MIILSRSRLALCKRKISWSLDSKNFSYTCLTSTRAIRQLSAIRSLTRPAVLRSASTVSSFALSALKNASPASKRIFAELERNVKDLKETEFAYTKDVSRDADNDGDSRLNRGGENLKWLEAWLGKKIHGNMDYESLVNLPQAELAPIRDSVATILRYVAEDLQATRMSGNSHILEGAIGLRRSVDQYIEVVSSYSVAKKNEDPDQAWKQFWLSLRPIMKQLLRDFATPTETPTVSQKYSFGTVPKTSSTNASSKKPMVRPSSHKVIDSTTQGKTNISNAPPTEPSELKNEKRKSLLETLWSTIRRR